MQQKYKKKVKIVAFLLNYNVETLYHKRSRNATITRKVVLFKMDLNKLRGILAEKRITQVSLAKSLNFSVKSVNAKLNGKVAITVEEANAITKIAGISNPAAIFFCR